MPKPDPHSLLVFTPEQGVGWICSTAELAMWKHTHRHTHGVKNTFFGPLWFTKWSMTKGWINTKVYTLLTNADHAVDKTHRSSSWLQDTIAISGTNCEKFAINIHSMEVSPRFSRDEKFRRRLFWSGRSIIYCCFSIFWFGQLLSSQLHVFYRTDVQRHESLLLGPLT